MTKIRTLDGKNIFLKNKGYINNPNMDLSSEEEQKSEKEKSGLLTLDRLIYINGEFDESLAKDVTLKLLDLSIKDKSPIVFMIDSFGGYVYSLLQIVDIMEAIPNKIITIITGKAMSSAATLAVCGTVGNRYILKNGTLMFHQLRYGSYGTVDEQKVSLKEAEKLQKYMNKIILQRTKIDPKNYDEFMSQDRYLQPQESLKLGIVDAVVNPSIMSQITEMIKTK